MESDNVDIVRRGYRAFEERGVEGILQFLDPGIEWCMSAAFTRMPRIYRGHDGVREVFRFFNELIEDLGAHPHEFIEAGDRVIVPVRLHGRLRESGEPVAYELVQVWTGQDGRAIRLVTYPDRGTAVADADLAGLAHPVASR
ncbi:MAG: nuclear transport factor 2 family protein [Solirubrobacteraceae bacterium]